MRTAGRIESAVIKGAREAGLPDTDKAGILTAQRLARELDDNEGDWEVAKDIAPKLMDALTKLGLTNAGRVVKGKGKTEEVPNNDDKKPPATVLQLLRNQHRAG